MTKICREAEASLDYYAMFKNILKQAPLPMSPLESLASSAVRTAHKVHASLIVVLTRGGSTGRLVAKYRCAHTHTHTSICGRLGQCTHCLGCC